MQNQSTTCNSNQKWNNKTCQCECKNYRKCKKDCSWNPSTCICENSKYFKSIADTSVTGCDETIIVIYTIATKKINTIATKKTNVVSTALINCHNRKVTDCYILHTVLLVINHITIDNYYYLISLCKTKRHNMKWKIMNLKKFALKIVPVIISMT